MLVWTVVNILVSLVLMLTVRRFVMTIYLLVNYVLLIQPGVIDLLFGIVHPRHILAEECYESALIFTAFFNLILGLSFVAFEKNVPALRSLKHYMQNNRLDHTVHPTRLILSCVVLLLIALGAKWLLHSLGAYRMLGEVQSSPFLQLFKAIAVFDVFVLIFVGEFKRARRAGQVELAAFYFLVAAIAVGSALLTGSRAQVATILVLVMIAHRGFLRKHYVAVTAALVPAIPSVFFLFPFLAHYRNSDYDFDEAVYQLKEQWPDSQANMMDVLTTRLNYMETVAYAMSYADRFGPAGGQVYWNNLLGLVPRLLWPGKPLIANGSQSLGHSLQLVSEDDTSTSIGLRPIGEAYFELAWLGLLVAVVQGLALAFLQRQFGHPSSAVLYTICVYTTIHIVSRDGFFAVLPGLVYTAIGFAIFFRLMTLMVPEPRTLRKRAVSGREVHRPQQAASVR